MGHLGSLFQLKCGLSSWDVITFDGWGFFLSWSWWATWWVGWFESGEEKDEGVQLFDDGKAPRRCQGRSPEQQHRQEPQQPSVQCWHCETFVGSNETWPRQISMCLLSEFWTGEIVWILRHYSYEPYSQWGIMVIAVHVRASQTVDLQTKSTERAPAGFNFIWFLCNFLAAMVLIFTVAIVLNFGVGRVCLEPRIRLFEICWLLGVWIWTTGSNPRKSKGLSPALLLRVWILPPHRKLWLMKLWLRHQLPWLHLSMFQNRFPNHLLNSECPHARPRTLLSNNC